MPSDITNYGYINTITDFGDDVKTGSTAIADAFKKAEVNKKFSTTDSEGRKLTNEQQIESVDGEVKNSIKGEKTQFAKTRATTKPTEAPIQKMFASIREVRNKTMKENGFADDEIEATNMFFDQLMDFMEEAEIKYEAIGLKDINNAELQVRLNDAPKLEYRSTKVQ